jgi:hypothetical protein
VCVDGVDHASLREIRSSLLSLYTAIKADSGISKVSLLKVDRSFPAVCLES